MKITVFGSGYVGLVTGVCFAEMGNHVICVDIDPQRVEQLTQGQSPIFEPGLTPLLKKNISEKRLSFTTEAKSAVQHGEIIFIAVGTPPDENGSADLKYVLQVARTIGENLIRPFTIIVNKSTVPVGTADLVNQTISEALTQTHQNTQTISYSVLSNPEFLKEGAAIADCMKPDRIVIGSNNEKATQIIKNLYAPFNRNHDKLIIMDVRSAELTKYTANAMLATKISFMNEISQLAEKVGADIEQVRRGIGSDSRIGYSFIYPGCGYGGSCFPKDIKALIHIAQEAKSSAAILNAVHQTNEKQKEKLFEKINKHFANQLKNKIFSIWGLSFKPNTDDIREAPSITLIDQLLTAGARVQAHDPEAMENFKKLYQNKNPNALKEKKLSFFNHPNDCLDNSDGLIILTEWLSFRSPDFELIQKKLSTPVIFDGRNLYDLNYLKSLGFNYYAIGRPEIKI